MNNLTNADGITLNHQLIEDGYSFTWIPQGLVTPEILQQLSHLYSNNYGVWGANNPMQKNGRVKLSANRIKGFFQSKDSKLAYGIYKGNIIAYAIVIQDKIKDLGLISWITQLVVHEGHRNKGVSKALLFSIWGFTNHHACGLLTANPYAVRALEKATRRRCQPDRIKLSVETLKKTALKHVSYVNENTAIEITNDISRVDTHFFVDHSEHELMLKQVTTKNIPWKLGRVDEGWEWLAFTFHDQPQISLTPEEINNMLAVSDHVAKEAYSRMLLNKKHSWANHQESESKHILKFCNLKSGNTVLDIGCGIGRHSITLAKLGLKVTGIDYLENLITCARNNCPEKTVELEFHVGDCRYINLNRTFDAVLCLYDVIGSYADEAENIKILINVAKHLKSGGIALLSVMNYGLTENLATQFFSLSKEPDKLLGLKPSNNMERTGEIFDPEYYMIDRENRVIYRREQFTEGKNLPTELIVRDRRYYRRDIEKMCRDVGLIVQWSRFIRAGDWNTNLESHNAKEILICCKKL